MKTGRSGDLNKIVAVSGYFAPLHRGHLNYFKEAKKLGDLLVVIVNNDYQLARFKNRKYPIEDRIEVIKELRCVDRVMESIDKDSSVCRTLERLKPDIFANGGDRTEKNIPEVEVCEKLGIKMVFGVGGEKIQSSTNLLKNYENSSLSSFNN